MRVADGLAGQLPGPPLKPRPHHDLTRSALGAYGLAGQLPGPPLKQSPASVAQRASADSAFGRAIARPSIEARRFLEGRTRWIGLHSFGRAIARPSIEAAVRVERVGPVPRLRRVWPGNCPALH